VCVRDLLDLRSFGYCTCVSFTCFLSYTMFINFGKLIKIMLVIQHMLDLSTKPCVLRIINFHSNGASASISIR
jgi:hypothetical protein